MLQALEAEEVRYVVIGGTAAAIGGALIVFFVLVAALAFVSPAAAAPGSVPRSSR